MSILEGRALCKAYGALLVLDDVSLEVFSLEHVAVVGPSGCGKTTLLRLLVGVEHPDAGQVTRAYPRAGYLPQGGMLFPWKTVLENVELPLLLQGVAKSERRRAVCEHLGPFGLSGFERGYPSELSGGMAQRAALLRTILTGASILFLDEPFGALDTITRQHLQDWLASVVRELDRTLVLVTHDLEEALILCRRVLVLSPRPATVRGEVRLGSADVGGRSLRMEAGFLAARESILRMLEGNGQGDE